MDIETQIDDGYIGTQIEKVLNEMGVECDFNLNLGEYYGMMDNVVITRNYGIKLPKKKATGIKGIFGRTTPTISLLDIVKRINEKWGVIQNNPSPEENRYYVNYQRRLGSFLEDVNLYLDEIVQKSKRPWGYGPGGTPFLFDRGTYNKQAKRLASLGCI